MVTAVAAPFGTKVQIDISNETLTARAALDLSPVLHELITNAVKYGSLGSERGSVSIRCSHASANDRYTIVWTERGGPTAHAPARTGFGTKLAEHLITLDLRGECEFAFEPDGLRCTMVIPAKELIAGGATCIHGCAH